MDHKRTPRTRIFFLGLLKPLKMPPLYKDTTMKNYRIAFTYIILVAYSLLRYFKNAMAITYSTYIKKTIYDFIIISFILF